MKKVNFLLAVFFIRHIIYPLFTSIIWREKMLKKIAILITFLFFILSCKGKSENSILLTYKFQQGVKFVSTVNSIVKVPTKPAPVHFQFDFETEYKEVLDNGNKVKLHYKYLSFTSNGKKTTPNFPVLEFFLYKNGKADIQSGPLKDYQSTIIFSDERVDIGDTWKTYLTVPVQEARYNCNVTAKFEKLVTHRNKKAAYIRYSGTKEDITINNVPHKVSVSGDMYFDLETGMYLNFTAQYKYFKKTGDNWNETMTVDVTTALQ